MRTGVRQAPTPPDGSSGLTSYEPAEDAWLRAVRRSASIAMPNYDSTAPQDAQATSSIPVADSGIAAATARAVAGVDLRSRAPEMPPFKVHGMEKWDGRILDIEDGIFTAELEPSEAGKPRIVAEFSLVLLAPETDVQPGDMIYATARTVIDRPGFPPTQTVNVRLRRGGNWTADESAAIRERAVAAKHRYDGLFE